MGTSTIGPEDAALAARPHVKNVLADALRDESANLEDLASFVLRAASSASSLNDARSDATEGPSRRTLNRWLEALDVSLVEQSVNDELFAQAARRFPPRPIVGIDLTVRDATDARVRGWRIASGHARALRSGRHAHVRETSEVAKRDLQPPLALDDWHTRRSGVPVGTETERVLIALWVNEPPVEITGGIVAPPLQRELASTARRERAPDRLGRRDGVPLLEDERICRDGWLVPRRLDPDAARPGIRDLRAVVILGGLVRASREDEREEHPDVSHVPGPSAPALNAPSDPSHS